MTHISCLLLLMILYIYWLCAVCGVRCVSVFHFILSSSSQFIANVYGARIDFSFYCMNDARCVIGVFVCCQPMNEFWLSTSLYICALHFMGSGPPQFIYRWISFDAYFHPNWICKKKKGVCANLGARLCTMYYVVCACICFLMSLTVTRFSKWCEW